MNAIALTHLPPMPTNRKRALANLVNRLVGERTNPELETMTGVNRTTVGQIKLGIVPTYRIFQRFVDGMEKHGLITLQQRAALFDAAGFADHAVKDVAREEGVRSVALAPPLQADPEPFDPAAAWEWVKTGLRAAFGPYAVRADPFGGKIGPDTTPEALAQLAEVWTEILKTEMAAQQDPNRVKY